MQGINDPESRASDLGPSQARPGRRAVSEWALTQLYELIFSGQLAPGDALGEIEVTALLGVSRSPTRDALRQLEDGGLLDVSPTSGRRTVKRFDIEDIHELYTIRIALESLAAREAAERITDEQLRTVEGHLAEMAALAATPTFPGHDFEADFRFHQAVCDASGLPRLTRLLTHTWLQTRALLRHLDVARIYPNADELKGALGDHECILERLRARDSVGAEQAVARHLRLRRDHLTEAVRGHGGIQ